jgi:hypothetical protein
MSETKTAVGPDGLIEFGRYLMSLREYAGYSFEVEQGGRYVDKTLEEVIELYRAFTASHDERFKLQITFCGGDVPTSTTLEFKRLRPLNAPPQSPAPGPGAILPSDV